jgi:antitoxin PrlF
LILSRFQWYYFIEKVMPMESALSIKGQATIPKAVREYLRLKPGDRVKFFMHPDGTVVILPKLPASALRGMMKSRKARPASLEDMDKAIAAAASRGFQRGKRL